MYLKVETPTDANKLSELLKDGDWLVLYYAEWCGHCNAMKPEWEKVVEKLKDSGKINIADIKNELIDVLSHKPKIEGFPTIKMYNKGQEVAKFEDERSAGKIQQFAISNANSIKQKAKTIKQIPEKQDDTVNAATNTIQLEELPIISAPIVADNSNEVKKLSISQLKDEIIKNHRTSKKQTKNMEMGDLTMLLQPPIPSVKASKKAEFIKNKTQRKTQRKTQKNSQKNANVIGIINNRINNKVPANSYGALACTDIKKAKWCKTNPKCFYDYIEFKCKDKLDDIPAPKLDIMDSYKGTKKSKKIHKHTKKHRQNQPITKENGTKVILQELQKSFKKISNEARKDSDLLAKASERI